MSLYWNNVFSTIISNLILLLLNQQPYLHLRNVQQNVVQSSTFRLTDHHSYIKSIDSYGVRFRSTLFVNKLLKITFRNNIVSLNNFYLYLFVSINLISVRLVQGGAKKLLDDLRFTLIL